MKIQLMIAAVLCLGLSAAEAAKDPSLLFEATFESNTLTADYAKGDPKCFTIADADLKATGRAMEGVGKKGTALVIDRSVDCLYNMKDNFDMKQGTVSMWVAPLNWKTSSKNIEVFSARDRKGSRCMWKNICGAITCCSIIRMTVRPVRKRITRLRF